MSVNKVILIGTTGSDVEVRNSSTGLSVAKLTVTTNDFRKDRNGQRQGPTEWHVVAFGKQAELCQRSCKPGRTVFVEGSIQTRTFDDEKGNRRYVSEIVAQTIRFIEANGPSADPDAGGELSEYPPECKAFLIGNIGRDVEVRHSPSGMAVAKFSVATNEYRKDKNGQRQEQTEWHNIVAFGKLAEFCGQHLGKGKSIFVDGAIQVRPYDDDKGNRRYFTEVIARDIRFVGPKQQGGEPAGGGGAPGGFPDNDDDIPF